MKNPVQLTEAITPIQSSLRPSSRRCRTSLILLTSALAWFAFSPPARAVCEDTCLGNYNTAQGEDALFSASLTAPVIRPWVLMPSIATQQGPKTPPLVLEHSLATRSASRNTANGTDALHWNTTGNYNTANGANALYSNASASQHGDWF